MEGVDDECGELDEEELLELWSECGCGAGGCGSCGGSAAGAGAAGATGAGGALIVGPSG